MTVDSFSTPGSGTWNAPGTGSYNVEIELVGAGGGGAGSSAGTTSGGNGAGGGAYCKKTVTVTGGVSSISYVVGAHGAGGAAASNGNDGGDSTATFSAVTYTAGGGKKGLSKGGGDTPGAGGTATNGDINTSGTAGTQRTTGNGSAGGAGAAPLGGAGGAIQGSSGDGNPGTAPGGGGGGSYQSSHVGGDGGNGLVRFTYTASSGTTYNDTIGESLSLADSYVGAHTMVGAISEPITVSGSFSAELIANASRSESISLSMSLAASATVAASVSESVTLSETMTGGLLISSTVTESISLGDTISASCTMAPGYSENLTPGVSYAAIATIDGAISESIALGDTMAGGLLLVESISETLALSDSMGAAATMAGGYAESMSLADSYGAGNNIGTAYSETMTLSDGYQASNVISVSISESVTPADSYVGDIADTGGGGEQTGGFTYPFPMNVGTMLQRSPVGIASLPPAFDPSQLTDLAIWISAREPADITKDGSDLVSGVVNHGNLGVGDAYSSGTNRPLYEAAGTAGGKPCFKLDTDDLLEIADHAALDFTNCSIFAVVENFSPSGSFETIFSKYSTTGNQREIALYLLTSGNAQIATSTDGTGGTVQGTNTTNMVSDGVTAIIYAGMDGANQFVQLNGDTIATFARTSVYPGTANVRLGMLASGQNAATLRLCELIVRTVNSTPQEIADIMDWLSYW